MTTYKNFQIGRGKGFFVINEKGQDLFYGIETLDKAKQAVDDILLLRKLGI